MIFTHIPILRLTDSFTHIHPLTLPFTHSFTYLVIYSFIQSHHCSLIHSSSQSFAQSLTHALIRCLPTRLSSHLLASPGLSHFTNWVPHTIQPHGTAQDAPAMDQAPQSATQASWLFQRLHLSYPALYHKIHQTSGSTNIPDPGDGLNLWLASKSEDRWDPGPGLIMDVT